MKRTGLMALVFATAMVVPAALAQEPAKDTETPLEQAAEPAADGEHGNLELWKWANFVVLAGGLGYLIGKNAGVVFEAVGRFFDGEAES